MEKSQQFSDSFVEYDEWNELDKQIDADGSIGVLSLCSLEEIKCKNQILLDVPF